MKGTVDCINQCTSPGGKREFYFFSEWTTNGPLHRQIRNEEKIEPWEKYEGGAQSNIPVIDFV